MADRLQRFRKFMENVDPAADPASAIDRDLYVAPPGRSFAAEIAGRMELYPWSHHLMAGGTGAGKSTELLKAQRRLAERPDMQALYIDVGTEHDLNRLVPGVLVVLAGLKLSELLKEDNDRAVQAARKHFEVRARGRAYWVPDNHADPEDDGPWPEEEPGTIRHIPGILSPPKSPEAPDGLWADQVQLEVLRRKLDHIVLLFDSLDRVAQMDAFEAVVTNDMRVLGALKIGVVLVGPIKVHFGMWRHIANLFDRFHSIPYRDPGDPAGRQFLHDVLRRRESGGVLPDEMAARIVDLSGGPLRDMIGLARDAAEEAYLSGSETIRPEDIEAAADALGRRQMVGLTELDLADLERLRIEATFVPRHDTQFALLTSGRVLLHATRFAVHPALHVLLEARAGRS